MPTNTIAYKIALIVLVLIMLILFSIFLGSYFFNIATKQTNHDLVRERAILSIKSDLDALKILDEKIPWQLHRIKELNLTMTQFKENYPENYTALINNLRLAMSIADSMKHESYILVIINGSDEYVKGFHILENLHGLYFSLYEDIYLGLLRENPDNYTLYRIQAYFLYLDFWDKIHNQMKILDQLYTIAGNSKVN